MEHAAAKAVRGVLLDVDGTLVDSNDAHAHAWVEALTENGIDAAFAEVRRLIGMGGDKLLPKVAQLDADSALGKTISKRRGEIFARKFLPTLQALPGAKDLLFYMRDRGLRLAVASSAKKDELKPLLKVCAADQVIEDQTSSDDAEHSKPDPDIIHAALKNLSMSPTEAVMLGDTPYDVEAATKAGVAAIAFRCGGWTDSELTGAAAVYQDPADLLAHFDTSPLAR